jgi:hypothetical protein
MSKESPTSSHQLLRIPQVVPMLSGETTVSLMSQEMKRRRNRNWIIPTMQQGSNRCLDLIKLEDKDQFLQASSSFQDIQTFSMDIVSLVVILDIRL